MWRDLEAAAEPQFFVEAPDAHKSPELARQAAFLRDMRILAPKVMIYANANAGKRGRLQAKAEGIRSGVFDLTCLWRDGIAWVEFKGFDSRGRAGSLSDNQITFGNRLVAMQKHCGCFFTSGAAIDWLRAIGAPVSEVRG